MRKLIPFIIVAFLLVSCSVGYDSSDTSVYMISVANSYYGPYRLGVTLKDQSAFVSEIAALASAAGNTYYEYTFTQDDESMTLMMDGTSYSASEVLDFLGTLEVGSDDLVIFYYSGHGGEEDESGKGTLLYFDPVITDDQVYSDDLLDVLASVGGRKLLILDCCYSGAAVTSSSLSRVLRFSEENDYVIYKGESVWDSITAAFSSGTVEGNNDIWGMAASQADQLSYEYDHGFFTYGLLYALGYDLDRERIGLPSSSKLTFASVFNDVVDKVYEYASSFGSVYAKSQTPSATENPVDLILFEL